MKGLARTFVIMAGASILLASGYKANVSAQNFIKHAHASQAVQGTSTEPTLSNTDAQIEETIKEAKGAQRDYRLGWIGLAIFLLGGLFLLYRIIKLR
jgi:hypothetical protein